MCTWGVRTQCEGREGEEIGFLPSLSFLTVTLKQRERDQCLEFLVHLKLHD